MSETVGLAREPSHGAATNWTEDGRLIAIDTPLGKDRLLLTSPAGEEAISSGCSRRIMKFPRKA